MYFKRETEWQKQLIGELAKTYGIDKRVVRSVVYYPFLFQKHMIISDDFTPIRHRHLGAILLKRRCANVLNVTKVEENS